MATEKQRLEELLAMDDSDEDESPAYSYKGPSASSIPPITAPAARLLTSDDDLIDEISSMLGAPSGDAPGASAVPLSASSWSSEALDSWSDLPSAANAPVADEPPPTVDRWTVPADPPRDGGFGGALGALEEESDDEDADDDEPSSGSGDSSNPACLHTLETDLALLEGGDAFAAAKTADRIVPLREDRSWPDDDRGPAANVVAWRELSPGERPRQVGFYPSEGGDDGWVVRMLEAEASPAASWEACCELLETMLMGHGLRTFRPHVAQILATKGAGGRGGAGGAGLGGTGIGTGLHVKRFAATLGLGGGGGGGGGGGLTGGGGNGLAPAATAWVSVRITVGVTAKRLRTVVLEVLALARGPLGEPPPPDMRAAEGVVASIFDALKTFTASRQVPPPQPKRGLPQNALDSLYVLQLRAAMVAELAENLTAFERPLDGWLAGEERKAARLMASLRPLFDRFLPTEGGQACLPAFQPPPPPVPAPHAMWRGDPRKAASSAAHAAHAAHAAALDSTVPRGVIDSQRLLFGPSNAEAARSLARARAVAWGWTSSAPAPGGSAALLHHQQAWSGGGTGAGGGATLREHPTTPGGGLGCGWELATRTAVEQALTLVERSRSRPRLTPGAAQCPPDGSAASSASSSSSSSSSSSASSSSAASLSASSSAASSMESACRALWSHLAEEVEAEARVHLRSCQAQATAHLAALER